MWQDRRWRDQHGEIDDGEIRLARGCGENDRQREREKARDVDGERARDASDRRREKKNELNKPNNVWH